MSLDASSAKKVRTGSFATPDESADVLATLEFRHLQDGSALLTTSRAEEVVLALTGEPLVKEAVTIKIEEATEDEVEPAASLNVFDYRKVKVQLRGGVQDTRWMAEVRFKVAVAMGFKTSKAMIEAIIEPAWRKWGIEVRHVGEAVCIRYELTYSWDAASCLFKIRGTKDAKATALVHPHIVNWKQYGLQFKDPFWRNMQAGFDPRRLVHKLRELGPMIVLSATPNSDDIEIEELHDEN